MSFPFLLICLVKVSEGWGSRDPASARGPALTICCFLLLLWSLCVGQCTVPALSLCLSPKELGFLDFSILFSYIFWHLLSFFWLPFPRFVLLIFSSKKFCLHSLKWCLHFFSSSLPLSTMVAVSHGFPDAASLRLILYYFDGCSFDSASSEILVLLLLYPGII